MSEIAKFMLIKTEADANSNKFWEAVLHEDDQVYCRWGRVGANGQSKTFGGGQRYIDKKIKEKKKKGYREARVTANGGGSSVAVGGSNLKNIAKQQIKASCPITTKLVDFLVKTNIHQITTQSGGKLNVDVATGEIQLPSGMGILTPDAIDDARGLINEINSLRNKRSTKKWKNSVQDYLMLVPQVIGRKRGWIDSIYSTDEEIAAQIGLLDSLEATLGAISKTPVKKNKKLQSVFNVNLSVVKDKKVVAHIKKLYSGTRKKMHSSYGYKPKTIYAIEIGPVFSAYEKSGKKVGNIKELWHGTKAANLLSILRQGLIIPKSGGSISVTGRMYGNGVYFSDQSTKALNYASGYWSGSSGGTSCFMFLADVAMGKSYTPKSWRGSFPAKGYDSTFAEGGKSGVMNNEMIIYKTSQCNLKFLVEFTK
jgi:poly [ADP-ribose] polymerase